MGVLADRPAEDIDRGQRLTRHEDPIHWNGINDRGHLDRDLLAHRLRAIAV